MSINLDQKKPVVFSGELTIERKLNLFPPMVVHISGGTDKTKVQVIKMRDTEAKSLLEKFANNITTETYKARFISDIEETTAWKKNPRHKNHFCEKMSLEFAHDGLKALKEKNKSNKKPFLSEADYELFYRKAFLGDTSIGKLSLNSAGGNKGKITGIFHKFYRESMEKGYTPFKGESILYQHLIIDNFEGWTEKGLRGNFKDKG
jgi:hypothetical protein